jgi:hypothetical protein
MCVQDDAEGPGQLSVVECESLKIVRFPRQPVMVGYSVVGLKRSPRSVSGAVC